VAAPESSTLRAVTSADIRTTASTLVVDAFGVPVEVQVRGDRAGEVRARLGRLWECCSPAAKGTAAVTTRVLFDSDPDAVRAAELAGDVARQHLEDLLQVLTQRITLMAIDARAGQCLMLHAACLADPATGAAAAFVAPGGTGKTTLVRTLGPGRWYVTDETTVVLGDRRVLFKNETPPSAIGLVPPQGPVHLAALCLLDRDDAHTGPPGVERLDTLDALVALVPQTSHLPEMPRPLQGLAALCESLGGVHRITYRESAEVAGCLDHLLRGAS
jgi:hypothetical protein